MNISTLPTLMTDARQIISDLGLPNSLQSNTSIYVFLTLLGMSPGMEWHQANNKLWRITPLMEEISNQGFASFKPNTRETIRDEYVGKLVDAYLVTPNPDEPNRSKNSPKYCYQFNPEVLALAKVFSTNSYNTRLQYFLQSYATLKQRYQRERDINRIPVYLPNGQNITISPGGQNPLIASIVKDFTANFSIDTVLYIGDSASRYSIFNRDFLEKLGVNIQQLEHSTEMPDVILYRQDLNVLVLVEAVNTGGEIDVERRDRLIRLFDGCKTHISFVNAFSTFKDFKKIIRNITWETHAWLAENPSHMIHFNGDLYWLPMERHHKIAFREIYNTCNYARYLHRSLEL
jgi:type II restriction enzyme